jgi:DNA-binding IclR family transcriptional regulator
MKIKINRTLADGLKILLLFDRATSLFTVPDISRRLGYSKSKGYRLVSTLIHYGFLQENSGTAQYCLGLNTFRLGLLAGRHFNLSGIARPLMKELCDLAKETVLLTAVSGTKGIVLDRVEAEHSIQYTLYQPGAIIPLYCGASGKILMAYLDEMDWDRIIADE